MDSKRNFSRKEPKIIFLLSDTVTYLILNFKSKPIDSNNNIKSYPNVTYYIVIKRRPLFYVFNMIMPSVLITIVGFLGFFIPPDSGEKVSMGVTTLLSMTVFLMVVTDSMPPNSDSVPLIGKFELLF